MVQLERNETNKTIPPPFVFLPINLKLFCYWKGNTTGNYRKFGQNNVITTKVVLQQTDFFCNFWVTF